MSTLEERRKLRAWRAGATKKAAQQALAAAHPGASGLNVKFRCATPQENLVGVGADVWRVVQRQLGGGSGGELRPDARGGGRPKFCSAWSSAALAVSSIAPFLQVADDGLTVGDIPGLSGGGTLEFECRRSAGVVGRRWPNLDFVVQATAGATFLESKTTEYLSLTHGELAAIYAKRAKEILPAATAGEVRAIADDRRRYHLVDAPQLVKHLLAAKTQQISNGSPVKLVYAFWEPSNAEAHPIFGEHRRQTALLFEALAPAEIELVALSWPELWAKWEQLGRPLAGHVQHLRSRYGVAIPPL